MFICKTCDAHLGLNSDPHTCDPDKILAHIDELKNRARTAEHKVTLIQDAVYEVMIDIPSLETDVVSVKPEWLRKLWDAAQCRYYDATTADSFLVQWIAMHHLLCEAFDVFRSKRGETLLGKLKNLRRSADHAKEVFGYEDSKLDLMPDDLVDSK